VFRTAPSALTKISPRYTPNTCASLQTADYGCPLGPKTDGKSIWASVIPRGKSK